MHFDVLINLISALLYNHYIHVSTLPIFQNARGLKNLSVLFTFCLPIFAFAANCIAPIYAIERPFQFF